MKYTKHFLVVLFSVFFYFLIIYTTIAQSSYSDCLELNSRRAQDRGASFSEATEYAKEFCSVEKINNNKDDHSGEDMSKTVHTLILGSGSVCSDCALDLENGILTGYEVLHDNGFNFAYKNYKAEAYANNSLLNISEQRIEMTELNFGYKYNVDFSGHNIYAGGGLILTNITGVTHVYRDISVSNFSDRFFYDIVDVTSPGGLYLGFNYIYQTGTFATGLSITYRYLEVELGGETLDFNGLSYYWNIGGVNFH